MKTTKHELKVETYKCDATDADMVSFSFEEPDKMIGGVLQLNNSYCAIADGIPNELCELHLNREVIEKVLRFLLNEYPKLRENELIQHCLSK